jgi:Xaa-Pro aminopeptidase
MRYTPIKSSFFAGNRRKLVSKLKPNSLVIVHSADEYPRNGDQFFPFRQNSDMYYLSGLDQEKCILLLCPDHPLESFREIVFTVKTSESMVTWYGHKYTLEQASELSGVKSVKWLDDFEDILRDVMVRSEHVYLNMPEDNRFQTEVPVKDLRFARRLAQDYPTHKYERLAQLVKEMRLCKQPAEIEVMSKACDITHKAFNKVLQTVKPGMMEYEVEAEITAEFLRNGASGHAYYPIVASGAGACVLHYISNDKECKAGDLLLLDFGAEYGNYAADLSRTIPISGKFSKRQKDCYNAVLRVMKQAKTLIVAGSTIDKINAAVAKLMEKEMIGLGLFTAADVKNQDPSDPLYFKYYMHGNSHFIGLDVHDVGYKQTALKAGNVLSCEPGLYIKEEGIGIRIENDILITAKGPVDLMKDIPVEAEDIERLMKKSGK